MSLLAASTIEVRPGAGADTNGGGASNVAGTNLSLQAAAAYAATDIVTNGTSTITSVASNWGTDAVDNWIYITGGTGSIAANWYRIVTRVSNLQLTLDRSTGLTTGTGATGNVGGALATIGGLGALIAAGGVSGVVAWVKNGTNTLTSSSANVSGGVFTTALVGFPIIGYSSTRGDLNNVIGSANRPIIDCGAITSITVFAAVTAGYRLPLANLIIDGKGNASVIGVGIAMPTNVTVQNCTTGFSGASCLPSYCSALVCGTGFSGQNVVSNCLTNDCTTAGYTLSSAGEQLINCISINDAIAVLGTSAVGGGIINCTLHQPTGDAISAHTVALRVINTVFTLPGGDAFDWSNANVDPATAYLLNNAYQAGTNLYETSPPAAQISGAITLTGDPYTSEATDDLSPNNTASAGASLRNAGIDVYGQTDNRDVGAVQHADPAGGSGGGSIFRSSIIGAR